MNKSDYTDLVTLRDWVRYGSSYFEQAEIYCGHGTDNPWDEALVLALWAIHQSWDRLDYIFDCRLIQSEKEKIAELYQRRVNERVPAAYLTGEAWFAGLKFKVTSDVLVPRSPLAEIINNGVEPWLTDYPEAILDMCTGSGCIGIAAAHAFSDADVTLADISPLALSVARENISTYDLNDRVVAVESDGFANLKGQTFDLILSNPPYVDEGDLASMPKEYQAEPEIGLGSGDDGLDFTRHLLKHAAEHLNDNGVLVVEVGNSWVTLEKTFEQIPFTWVELENGGHGVFVLTKEQLLDVNI